MSLPDSVLDAVNNTSWTAKTSSGKPSSVGSDDAQSETPQQTSYRSSPSNTTILSNREGRSGSPLKHLLHRRQASGPVLVDDIFSPPIPDSEKPGNSELSQSNSTGVSIRYSGWIGRVEGDIEAFEAEKEKLKEKQESQSDSLRSRTRVKSTSRDSTGSLKRDSPSLLDHKLKIHSDGTTRDSPTVRELAASTTSQKRTSPLIRLSPRYPASSHINPHATRHTSPTQHALALLHERAKMLEELAKLEALRAR
ncbi:hypothetical protein FRC02_009250 [Tulasnella sp. 418]|nr:hypothetical protein FRC02_009250 [Tulasnella sp. 418]